jgi:hypothetical protein
MTQTATAVKATKTTAPKAVIAAKDKTTTLKTGAIKIFNRVMASKTPTRARVIEQLVEKLGLTPGGASTYYANMKNGLAKKAGGWDVTAVAVKAGAVKAKAKPVVKAVAVAKPAKAATKPAKPVAKAA